MVYSLFADALILARHQQYISDTEFILLFEYNLSKPLFPYWKFELFDLDSWDDHEECKIELRFAKSDLALLKRLLGIPDKITCQQGTTCSGIEGLCIFLKRLAYPCRYPDMAIRLGRNPSRTLYLTKFWIWSMMHTTTAWRVGISLFCHQSCYKIVLMQYMTRVPHWKTALDLSMALFAQLLDRNTTSDKFTMVTRVSIPLNFKVLCCLMVLLLTLLSRTKVKDMTVQCFAFASTI